MPVLKTPKYVDHPAENLSKLISNDIKAQFLKTPKFLLIENQVYLETLKNLRNNFKYSYIIQWVYLLKHIIKLSDAFDVENFEEELLGIAPPNFLNNLKLKLIQFLKNQKLVNIDLEFDFFVDQIYQDYNLLELNDLAPENNNNNNNTNDDDDSPVITYSKLPLVEKIDVLYNLIKLSNTKNYANFRKNVDKFEKPQIDLKIHPIFEIIEKNLKKEYIILQDARVYLRTWEFNNLNLPLNKDEFNEKIKNPYDDLLNLNPIMKSWECLTAGIYQFDDFIKQLKSSFGKKSSSNEFTLSKILEANIDFIIDHDLKKRKQSAQRKREIEMQLLMANRKRSSRLEEKEKRKREEEAERMKELEIIKQQAAEIRAAKRQKLRDSLYINGNNNNNSIILDTSLSREERLKKRQEGTITPSDETGTNPSAIAIDEENLISTVDSSKSNEIIEPIETAESAEILETESGEVTPKVVEPVEQQTVQIPVEESLEVTIQIPAIETPEVTEKVPEPPIISAIASNAEVSTPVDLAVLNNESGNSSTNV